MFKKILIANRGEIACRVIKTARKMGIATVALYSDADEGTPHTRMADEAYHVGGAAPSESYLRIDRILEIVKETGAQAVHPGYGFLSERASFAKALADAGIAFIGPNPYAIEAMGDKIESKKLAHSAGVSTVPGHIGIIETADDAVDIAKSIGFPVMIKASAGGGGKGMRIAHDEAETRDGFERAKSEAKTSFGDDRVFIEKFIVNPRHIEIQVLGDKHGNIVYLNERECSIQRRNQKVIEEAPSAFVDPQMREAMGKQSVELARAVKYDSAGTVEFVVGEDKSFYFLEMNTRLQVEHPVTECITGLDLVEEMIRSAYGEKLRHQQSDIGINGWAIEARVYAEDPFKGFVPSIGRLTKFVAPQEGESGSTLVRNDTGVEEGGEISPYYDPMISKLITHSPTREEASLSMARALDRYLIEGIEHNIPFLSALVTHPRWTSGEFSTGFIAQEYPDGFKGAEVNEEIEEVLLGVGVFVALFKRVRLDALSGRLRPHSGELRSEWCAFLGQSMKPIRFVNASIGEATQITFENLETSKQIDLVSTWKPGLDLFMGELNGNEIAASISQNANSHIIHHHGASQTVKLMSPRLAELYALMPIKEPPDLSKYLICPMPGVVKSVMVQIGDHVQAGAPLAIVEAMKMENVLKAEREGIVKSIECEPGDTLAVDTIMMEFETTS